MIERWAKPPVAPKKPNKKRALTPAQKKNLKIAENLMSDWKNTTILEAEKE